MKYMTFAVLASVLVGCNAGMAPEGPSATETKKIVDTMPFDKRVDFIKTSPAPRAQKEKELKELFEKNGKTYDPSVLDGGPSGAPAPGGGAPAPAPGN